MRPSFIGAMLNGLLMMVIIVLTIANWQSLDQYQKIMSMSAIGLLLGVHAVLHHFEEIYYGYNPLEDHWKHDKLIR